MLWLAAAAWSGYGLATSWPYVQLMPQWLLLFAVVGILFRSLELRRMRRGSQPLQGRERLRFRVFTLIGGIFIAGALWSALDRVSMGRFERAMAPMVERVNAHAKAPCPPAAAYRAASALAAYMSDAGAPRAVMEVNYDPERFVLVLAGRSMDIDGSAIFYDSRSRAWKKVHNDQLAVSGELENLRKGLQGCRVELKDA